MLRTLSHAVLPLRCFPLHCFPLHRPITLHLVAIAALIAQLLGCGTDGGVERPDGAADTSTGDGAVADTVGAVDSYQPLDVDGILADSRDTGDVSLDSAEPDVTDSPDTLAVPTPDPVAPCDAPGASCWTTAASTFACRAESIDEDYSSGTYNVHGWALRIYAGATTTITLTARAGAWNPAIMLTRPDGATLYDGAVGVSSPGLLVTPVDDGRSGGQAKVDVFTDTDIDLVVYLTAWQVIDGGYTQFLATDATYTLAITSTCDQPTLECVVNGYTVGEPACGWLHYVATAVVPRLQGTRAERLTAASRVAWWSLKEGVMFLENPLVYSNCNFSTGDQRIGPVDVCVPNRAWQVGLAAVQVPWSPPLAQLEELALALFPGMTPEEVLGWAADEARQDVATRATIVSSSGDLRRSWLLRASPIGFTIEAPVVTQECVVDSLSWCYGTGWSTTQKFAPDRAGALRAIDDIHSFLDALAP